MKMQELALLGRFPAARRSSPAAQGWWMGGALALGLLATLALPRAAEAMTDGSGCTSSGFSEPDGDGDDGDGAVGTLPTDGGDGRISPPGSLASSMAFYLQGPTTALSEGFLGASGSGEAVLELAGMHGQLARLTVWGDVHVKLDERLFDIEGVSAGVVAPGTYAGGSAHLLIGSRSVASSYELPYYGDLPLPIVEMQTSGVLEQDVVHVVSYSPMGFESRIDVQDVGAEVHLRLGQ